MPRPIKVLQVIARLNIGGTARQMAVLVDGLDPAYFSTLVITGLPSADEGDLASLLPARVPHLVIPQLGRAVHPVRDLIALVRLCRLLWQQRPDVIHTHTAKAGALGRVAARWYNAVRWLSPSRPSVRQVHMFHGHVLSGYFGEAVSGLFVRIERWLGRSTDVLIAINPSLQRELLRLRIGDDTRLRVVPLGLELAELQAVNGYRYHFRNQHQLSADEYLVGIVGRLVPIKQHELFLEAASRLARRHPRARCVIIGDGERRHALESFARALGISDRVRFVSWQLCLADVYADLDCVCLTSRNEGTPVSLIEAMAAGRPVVSTAVGGVADLLGEMVERGQGYDIAERGVLVQLAAGADGMAAALERVAADLPLRQRLVDAGRSYVGTRFTARRFVTDMATIYEELTACTS